MTITKMRTGTFWQCKCWEYTCLNMYFNTVILTNDYVWSCKHRPTLLVGCQFRLTFFINSLNFASTEFKYCNCASIAVHMELYLCPMTVHRNCISTLWQYKGTVSLRCDSTQELYLCLWQYTQELYLCPVTIHSYCISALWQYTVTVSLPCDSTQSLYLCPQFTGTVSLPCDSTQLLYLSPATVQSYCIFALWQYTVTVSLPCDSTQLLYLCRVTVHSYCIFALWQYTVTVSLPCNSTAYHASKYV